MNEQRTRVKHHLDECASCAEQYADLLEITLAEQAGEIAVPAFIPSPDLTFLPLTPPERLRKYVVETAARVLAVLSPKQVPTLQAIAEPFFEQIDSLGGKFVLERRAAQALGFEGSEEDEALTILAATFAAIGTLVNSLTREQMDALAAQDRLRARIEKEAQSTAEVIQVDRATARQFAQQFAQAICDEPAELRALLDHPNA